jgi:apoptosis-inducing factor 2
MASAAKRNVVVIGGGAAGTDVARELSTKLDASKYDLVLVTPRPFSVWLPALVRAVVTSDGNLESLEKGALVPYGMCVCVCASCRVLSGQIAQIVCSSRGTER